ncbi:MAG TPA: hypothetical protein VF791_13010 [Pyrinomonadaceae bacterium]
MEHKLTITLPDEVYQPLLEVAEEQGRTPEEVATERLARGLSSRKSLDANAAHAAEARFTRHIGAVNSGDARSADNDRIDADLAREYGSTHDK